MPFIPHTQQDIQEMLHTIDADNIDALFDEIPASLRADSLEGVPERMSEMEVTRLMSERADQDSLPLCFLGAGAYEHFIPAAVWQIATRGEFYSAYTPYQAEASQGTLQLLYEYQSMMTDLTGMDASNASLYDGASALAEAVLMAVRVNRKSKSRRILVPRTVHPLYRRVTHAIVNNQGIVLEEMDYDKRQGIIDPATLPDNPGDVTALVIPQPNFFGNLEEVDALTDWAHRHNALVIAVVNPVSLAILTPPGEWGKNGADIACGEGQPLGVPLSSGGPYFGILCCREAFIRQLPGRIVGRTMDEEGKPGYTLTLQTREQHIRRAKATSNICTNQGLLVTAATVYMSLMGPEGLERTARTCHTNTVDLVDKLTAITGVEKCFDRPFFHEAALKLDRPTDRVLAELLKAGVLGGYDLAQEYPELDNGLLVCATETRTEGDISRYGKELKVILGGQVNGGCVALIH